MTTSDRATWLGALRGRLRPVFSMRTLRMWPLLVAVFLLGTGVHAVVATFTSAPAVAGNAFVTGNVDISASPASAFITLSRMGPGDVVTAPVTVTNSGSLQLRYAVTSTTSENPLAGQLDLYVKSGVTTCTNAGFGSSGTVLYNDTSHLGSTTSVNLVGNPSQGAQAGDRVLNTSANETLCFQISMPTAIANTYHSITETVVFAFVAEQTQNN